MLKILFFDFNKAIKEQQDKTNLPAEPAMIRCGLKVAVLIQATSRFYHVRGHDVLSHRFSIHFMVPCKMVVAAAGLSGPIFPPL